MADQEEEAIEVEAAEARPTRLLGLIQGASDMSLTPITSAVRPIGFMVRALGNVDPLPPAR